MEIYNKTLCNILDLHSPVRTRTVSFSCSTPWFTGELRKMKTTGHALERRYKASELTVHKHSYQEHQRAYSNFLREAWWSQFYSNIIKENPGNSKQLFSTINHLLKPQTAQHIETTEEQCNNFMAFFSSKVDTINFLSGCLSTLPILTLDPQSGISQLLPCFPEVSQQ